MYQEALKLHWKILVWGNKKKKQKNENYFHCAYVNDNNALQ